MVTDGASSKQVKLKFIDDLVDLLSVYPHSLDNNNIHNTNTCNFSKRYKTIPILILFRACNDVLL